MEQQLVGLEKHLHRIFLAGAVFGALSCFARADYNLPLYAFLYLMWDQDQVFATPLNSDLTLFIGRQVQAYRAFVRFLDRGPALDALLGAALALGRDEGLAEGPAQLRHFLHIRQLHNETRSHRNAVAH